MNEFYKTERQSSVHEKCWRYGEFEISYNPWEFKQWARETLDFELLYEVCPFPAECTNRSEFFYSWLEEQPEFVELFWKRVLLDDYDENHTLYCERMDYEFNEWIREQEDYDQKFLESDDYKYSYERWEERDEKYRNENPYFESDEYYDGFSDFMSFEYTDEKFKKFRDTDVFKWLIDLAVSYAAEEVLEAGKREKARRNHQIYVRVYGGR